MPDGADIRPVLLKPSPALRPLLFEFARRRERRECEESLYTFVRSFWRCVEPETPFVGSWPLRAMCLHLEAVTAGRITRLCTNVYPGSTKSLIHAVFWPAWEWGPKNLPHLRYLCFAYSSHLTERDNRRFKQLITHPKYKKNWGDRFAITREPDYNVMNDKSGWKLASSVGGVGTGERGDRTIIDDGNKPPTDADPIGESNATLRSTAAWFREILPDRLNSLERSAIINIQQRTSDIDITGIILELGLPYEHLCIPMMFDTMPDKSGARRPLIPTSEGWIDPRYREDWWRAEEDPEYDPCGALADEDELLERDGTIADPRRFPPEQLDDLRRAKGEYAWASQYQQTVMPRGGGIIKQEWWKLWEDSEFPAYGTCVASIDTAYKLKETSDYNAFIVFGAFPHPDTDKPKLMLRDAWKKRCSLNELVKDVIASCRRHKVDTLLIEDSARGMDLRDEIDTFLGRSDIRLELVPVAGDKSSRLNAVSALFENEVIYAPDTEWADEVIKQVANFPRASHDDFVDAVSQALIWMRKTGVAVRREEYDDEVTERLRYRKQPTAVYDV
jgi:predicted phage terminase large subunit-like protein